MKSYTKLALFVLLAAGVVAAQSCKLFFKSDYAELKAADLTAFVEAAYPEMQKRGGGAIVNQSSTAAYLYSGFYGLAKVGVNGLTQQLAHELGGMGIRVNAIAPGPTDTAATHKQAGDAAKELVKGMALKRMGQPADMVGACLFLLSDEASWVTGQIIAVDGGQTFRS